MYCKNTSKNTIRRHISSIVHCVHATTIFSVRLRVYASLLSTNLLLLSCFSSATICNLQDKPCVLLLSSPCMSVPHTEKRGTGETKAHLLPWWWVSLTLFIARPLRRFPDQFFFHWAQLGPAGRWMQLNQRDRRSTRRRSWARTVFLARAVLNICCRPTHQIVLRSGLGTRRTARQISSDKPGRNLRSGFGCSFLGMFARMHRTCCPLHGWPGPSCPVGIRR